MGKNKLWTFLFFLWMGTLTTLSLLPSDQLDVKTPPIPLLDKWVHLAFYSIGMTLGALFLRESRYPKGGMRKALVIMALVLILYGMVIEVLQGMTNLDRSAEWWDIVANMLGVGFGTVLALFLFRKVKAFNWRD